MFTPAKLLTKYFLNNCPADGPVKQTDFEMHFKPVDLAKYKEEIFSYSNIAAIRILETTKYQNENFEIYQIDIKREQSPSCAEKFSRNPA